MTAQAPPPRPPPTPAARAAKRLTGSILMTMGALVALLCGSCTAIFLFGGLAARNGGGPLVLFSLVFGGLPTGAGVALVVLGRSIFREGVADRDDG